MPEPSPLAQKLADELATALPAWSVQMWNEGEEGKRVLISYSATPQQGMRGQTYFKELNTNLPILRALIPHLSHVEFEQEDAVCALELLPKRLGLRVDETSFGKAAYSLRQQVSHLRKMKREPRKSNRHQELRTVASMFKSIEKYNVLKKPAAAVMKKPSAAVDKPPAVAAPEVPAAPVAGGPRLKRGILIKKPEPPAALVEPPAPMKKRPAAALEELPAPPPGRPTKKPKATEADPFDLLDAAEAALRAPNVGPDPRSKAAKKSTSSLATAAAGTELTAGKVRQITYASGWKKIIKARGSEAAKAGGLWFQFVPPGGGRKEPSEPKAIHKGFKPDDEVVLDVIVQDAD